MIRRSPRTNVSLSATVILLNLAVKSLEAQVCALSMASQGCLDLCCPTCFGILNTELTRRNLQSRFLPFTSLSYFLGRRIIGTTSVLPTPILATKAYSISFGNPSSELPPNTFQVPDCDDEEDEPGKEDEDVSFVQETILKPKFEVAVSALRGSEELTTDVTTAIDVSDTNKSPSGTHQAQPQAGKIKMMIDENQIPSAESSRYSETERQTASISRYSDGDLQGLSPGNAYQQKSIRSIPVEYKTSAVDEDLTQSESESGDDASQDLMVHDSEDEQRCDVLTDYGSDSDEDALFVAEVRTTKPAPAVDDSTDSDSSHSESCADSAFEGEEDVVNEQRDHGFHAKDSQPGEHINERSEALTEQETTPLSTRHDNDKLHCPRFQQVPYSSFNRAPSPSDAALAKPCDSASNNQGQLGGSYQYTAPQSWMDTSASACEPAWPSVFNRSHGGYNERTGGFPYPYGPSFVPGSYAYDSFRTFPSSMPLTSHQDFNLNYNEIKQPDQPADNNKIHPPPPPPPPVTIPSSSNEALDRPAHPPPIPSQPAAKVSIDSIVQHDLHDPTASQKSGKLKRKVDEMSSDVVAEPAREERPETSQVAESTSSALQPPHSKPVSVAQVKAMQNMSFIGDSGDSVEQRSTKRARTAKESGKAGFATLAVTALAGALVGSVGVVAALVSLPPDFFV